VQGKFTTVNLLVKFLRESPKNPSVSQCAHGAEGGAVARFFLKLITLAKWGRRKRIPTLKWLGNENK